MPDIEKILDTLIYDGKVERRLQAGGGVQEQLKLYRATQTLLPPVGLVKTPCGICPVSRNWLTNMDGDDPLSIARLRCFFDDLNVDVACVPASFVKPHDARFLDFVVRSAWLY